MKTYTIEELNKVLENHKHWLLEDCAGWNHMRADLTRADLTGANLYGADLYGANLTGANLTGANLYGANLYGADLYGADLTGANLTGANLTGADLTGANLTGANLTGANLYGADLTRANNIPFIPMACPTHGSFIGWKKANTKGGLVIVKLEILEDAKRSSATSRKCRCDKALVLEIQTLNGTIINDENILIESTYDYGYRYKVGDVIEPRMPFEEDRFIECASGIHFFIDKQDAINY